jgi:nucleotide-binding universal stress UspA family protein
VARPYQRIIVPLDGSDLAEAALNDARVWALTGHIPIHLVRVIDLSQLERYGAYGLAVEYAGLAKVAEDEQAEAIRYLDEIVKTLRGDGIQADREVVRGAVISAICALARPEDLIAMASHGRSGVTRWFLGSVTEGVVRRAPCPVLVVRAATE